jgi:hypothetical protein
MTKLEIEVKNDPVRVAADELGRGHDNRYADTVLLAEFAGQVTIDSVGTHIFDEHGAILLVA